MARAVGITDAANETHLALASLQLGRLDHARQEAERIAALRLPEHQRPHLALAELWHAIGDPEQATRHALAAYRSAWADGEPYVYRCELERARSLLEALGAEIPKLAPYDPARAEKLSWEEAVEAAIAERRAEKEEKRRAENEKKRRAEEEQRRGD
jgi:hypothetical protein